MSNFKQSQNIHKNCSHENKEIHLCNENENKDNNSYGNLNSL